MAKVPKYFPFKKVPSEEFTERLLEDMNLIGYDTKYAYELNIDIYNDLDLKEKFQKYVPTLRESYKSNKKYYFDEIRFEKVITAIKHLLLYSCKKYKLKSFSTYVDDKNCRKHRITTYKLVKNYPSMYTFDENGDKVLMLD